MDILLIFPYHNAKNHFNQFAYSGGTARISKYFSPLSFVLKNSDNLMTKSLLIEHLFNNVY